MGIRFDTKAVDKAFDAHRARVAYGLRQAAIIEARRLAIRAQQDRPWQDRTGAARRSIHGSVTPVRGGMRIAISGSVNYMVYLELARGKKWAVLWPTIERHGKASIENIAKFMEGIK